MYKAIFHLDDEETGSKLVNNVKNLFKDMEGMGEELEVEVLANASGVKVFKKNQEKDEVNLNVLFEKGVNIAICQNTLNNLKLSKEDMLDGITVVRSGVGELTRKQNAGWAYIKP